MMLAIILLSRAKYNAYSTHRILNIVIALPTIHPHIMYIVTHQDYRSADNWIVYVNVVFSSTMQWKFIFDLSLFPKASYASFSHSNAKYIIGFQARAMNAFVCVHIHILYVFFLSVLRYYVSLRVSERLSQVPHVKIYNGDMAYAELLFI